MNDIDGVITFASSVMVLLFLGFFVRSMIRPRKKLPYIDVSKKTIKELMESGATIEDLVRSIQKVEGK